MLTWLRRHFSGGATASRMVRALEEEDWRALLPAASPPVRESAGMAFDAATGAVVLFGGLSGSAIKGDTWTL